jgi:hypothetical protein
VGAWDSVAKRREILMMDGKMEHKLVGLGWIGFGCTRCGMVVKNLDSKCPGPVKKA